MSLLLYCLCLLTPNWLSDDDFATREKVQAPILTAVAQGILARKPVEDILQRLMTAPMTGPA